MNFKLSIAMLLLTKSTTVDKGGSVFSGEKWSPFGIFSTFYITHIAELDEGASGSMGMTGL
jgi:hypothetical protein